RIRLLGLVQKKATQTEVRAGMRYCRSLNATALQMQSENARPGRTPLFQWSDSRDRFFGISLKALDPHNRGSRFCQTGSGYPRRAPRPRPKFSPSRITVARLARGHSHTLSSTGSPAGTNKSRAFAHRRRLAHRGAKRNLA